MKKRSNYTAMPIALATAAALLWGGVGAPALAQTGTDQVASSEQPAATVQAAVTYSNVFRMYNPNSGEHFYTRSMEEAKHLVNVGWSWEGVGWVAPSEGDQVYRLYSGTDHFYTTSVAERDDLVSVGWSYEGVGWVTEDENEGRPLYRQFNPNADPSASYNNSGSHNYTLSKGENDYLVSVGWRAEGIGWYGADQDPIAIDGFWINGPTQGDSTPLYWVGSDGNKAVGRVIDPAKNAVDSTAGVRAYALPKTGAVVTGKYTTEDGYVILASSKGKLESRTGWIETGAYDNGTVHRYYMVDLGNGLVGAKTGDFTVGGKQYHGIADEGYVVQNGTWIDTTTGTQYTADKNGVITKKETVDYGAEIANLAAALAVSASDGSQDLSVPTVCSQTDDPRAQDYIKVHDMTLIAWGGNKAYASCTQAVATVLAATVDPNIGSGKTNGSNGPGPMLQYLRNSDVFQRVTSGPILPGDIFADGGHDAIYVGPEAAQRYFGTSKYTVYEANYGPRTYPSLHYGWNIGDAGSYGREVYRAVKKGTPQYGTSFIDYSFALR